MNKPTDDLEQWNTFESELVIGLCGAVGTELRRVAQVLGEQLKLTGYKVERLQISDEIIPLLTSSKVKELEGFERINALMTAGNEARSNAEDDSILALGAASYISSRRPRESEGAPQPVPKRAVIVSSLKRPEEVERLRSIYPNFFMLGVFAEEEKRLDYLEKQKGISLKNAQKLIARDKHEKNIDHGQQLHKTFPLADFFIRPAGEDTKLRGDLKRIVELLFGRPTITPSFDEFAMFMAFSASLRSADLSRQVGSVIAKDKQILATGANDCPSCSGGLYWPEADEFGVLKDVENGRDSTRGFDSNRREQDTMIEELILLAKEKDIDEDSLRSVLGCKQSPIRSLTEYGRVVHAEMEALLSIARSNHSTVGASIYCTTFPCHNCAKHLIAAGIRRVVYIEPYEKSKAVDFHNEAILLGFDKDPTNSKVKFQPFLGIGPRRFFDLFSMNYSSGYDLTRKDKSGNLESWNPKTSQLRLRMWPRSYLEHELDASILFGSLTSQTADSQTKDDSHQ